MGTASLTLSIVGLIVVLVGLVPFLGWLNWFAVLLLVLAVLFGVIGLFPSGGRGKALAGIIVSLIFLSISLARLILGLGVV
jgi:hypothetical protein